MKIKNFIKVSTIDEAYKLFSEKKSYRLIGGGAFLGLGKSTIINGIDLDCLNLDYIEENDEYIEIGAMTTLRTIETSEILKNNFDGIIAKSTMDIVGVQLRNIATIGGTVAGRYGFSDILTALLVLDTKIVFHNLGEVTLENLLKMKKLPRDIITKILIKKGNVKASFKMMRNSTSDYAILNCGVSKTDDIYKIVVGATPRRATIALESTKVLNVTKDINMAINLDNLKKDIVFGDDLRASKEYRDEIVGVLIKRAFMEVNDEN